MTLRTVLHVGCGRKTLAQLPMGFRNGGWQELRLDIDPSCAPDIVGTITDMSVVQTGSVDAVFSSHNIEHVFSHEVPLVLAEIHRILRPEGFTVITCPDLQVVGNRISEGKLLDKMYDSPAGAISAYDIIFGHRASISRGQFYMAHRGGFTATSMSDALRSSNLASYVVTRSGFNLWALATKRTNDNQTLHELANFYFNN